MSCEKQTHNDDDDNDDNNNNNKLPVLYSVKKKIKFGVVLCGNMIANLM